MKAGPVTKIRYRRVCEKPVDLLLNLGTRSKGTIYTCAEGPMNTHTQRAHTITKLCVHTLWVSTIPIV